MNNYKLSVVVLVYNTEQYLRECLDSLVNQTLKDIEIIIVNDESPDNSALIINEYYKKYNNIVVINQKNSGGAVAGNNGLMHARGEFVTIMDSDDVVPLNAYELMYEKAIKEDADIVIGKPKLLIRGQLREVGYEKERQVWEKDRIIQDISEYPDIFYDGFYWNKIYKREFLLKNDCLMPPGMLYADRPMVHKAFLHAKKIVIIPEVVYYWRKREESARQKSITQLKNDINNFKDRIISLRYQLDYFNKLASKKLINEFQKRNIERLLFPIKGILESEEFKKIYLEETKDIYSQIDNIYDNDLGIIKNLYIYMILNDLTDELIYYLKENPKGKIIKENDDYYWDLPYFRDEKVNIPDELYKINVLLGVFINIEEIKLEGNILSIKNISFPKKFNINSVNIIIQSRKDSDYFIKFDSDSKENIYSFNIDIQKLDLKGAYDIYLLVNYDDNKSNKFRIERKMLDNNYEIISENDNYTLYFTKNNLLSLINTYIKINKINLDFDKIEVKLERENESDPIEFLVKDRLTKEYFYFKELDINNFELKWKHFLDPNRTYDFYYKVFNKTFHLHKRYVKKIERTTLVKDNISIKLYVTKKGNLSIATLSNIRSKINKLLYKFK